MSEQSAEISVSPTPAPELTDLSDQGLTIERNHVSQKLPVAEIFPDRDTTIQEAREDLKRRVQEKSDLPEHTDLIDNLTEEEISKLYQSSAFDYEALAGVTQDEIGKAGYYFDRESRFGSLYHSYANEDESNSIRLKELSEAFSFTSWGETVNLYNYSPSLLTDDHLRQIAFSLRSVGQEVGSRLFETFSSIAIVPDGHPSLISRKSFAGDVSFVNGTVSNGTLVIINDRLLSTDPITEEMDTLPDLKPHEVSYSLWEKMGRTFTSRVLNKETPGQKRRRKSFERAELERAMRGRTTGLPHNITGNIGALAKTMIHELQHILASSSRNAEKEFGEHFVDSKGFTRAVEVPPSRYATKDVHERLAETGTANIINPGMVGEEHTKAYRKFLRRVQSPVEGPTQVTGREVDPRSLAEPRLRQFIAA